MNFNNIRRDYQKSKIDFNHLDENPIVFFLKWLEEAFKFDKDEANACVLSTISCDNKPSSRVVLLKEVRDNRFIFYTNYNSNKAVHITNNNSVALNFFWPQLERQVRIQGIAQKISEKDSDKYFNARPKNSKLSVWISNQSSEIDMSLNVEKLMQKLDERFNNKEIDRPVYWGGYSIKPIEVEFWQGRPSRFHDRVLYQFYDKNWHIKRLAP